MSSNQLCKACTLLESLEKGIKTMNLVSGSRIWWFLLTHFDASRETYQDAEQSQYLILQIKPVFFFHVSNNMYELINIHKPSLQSHCRFVILKQCRRVPSWTWERFSQCLNRSWASWAFSSWSGTESTPMYSRPNGVHQLPNFAVGPTLGSCKRAAGTRLT